MYITFEIPVIHAPSRSKSHTRPISERRTRAVRHSHADPRPAPEYFAGLFTHPPRALAPLYTAHCSLATHHEPSRRGYFGRARGAAGARAVRPAKAPLVRAAQGTLGGLWAFGRRRRSAAAARRNHWYPRPPEMRCVPRGGQGRRRLCHGRTCPVHLRTFRAAHEAACVCAGGGGRGRRRVEGVLVCAIYSAPRPRDGGWTLAGPSAAGPIVAHQFRRPSA